MSGWICYPVKRKRLITMMLVLLIIGAAYWCYQQPRNAQQIFEVRCSACHQLQRQVLCQYASSLRASIVETMRRSHGADANISEADAATIKHYLEMELKCP